MSDSHQATRRLDAIKDVRHASYKVPGLISWVILGLSLVAALAFPYSYLTAARLFALYLIARLSVKAVFYLVGVARCRRWQARGEPNPGPLHQVDEPHGTDDVHHVVLLPNYKEPMAVLRRTLHALAIQRDAHRRLTVVLATEEREVGARAKAQALCAAFAERFAQLLVTVHPEGLPGEIPCKGSNLAWAARQAKVELVDRLGLPVERMTLTVCDADSILHPHYFAELTRLFARDRDGHRRFWYAPVHYHNNIWEVLAPIRLLAFTAGAAHLAELATPFAWPLPVSTYSLSFKLADEVGYWDPAVISEDWHMYLRCFFATRGQVNLIPIFLPTSIDAVDGETAWDAVRNYYHQQVRHAWGAEDVGYILQQWRSSRGNPTYRKLRCLAKVLHCHLLRSTSWFVIALGALVSGLSRGMIMTSPSTPFVFPDPIWSLNLLGAGSSVVMWAIERARCRSPSGIFPPLLLAQEVASWVLVMPAFSFLFAFPGLHAQTKLLIGSAMTHRPTPKWIRTSRAGERLDV